MTTMEQALLRLRFAALAAIIAVWPLSPLSAATLAWTGGGASGLWSDPANWSLGRVPGAGDDVEFSGNPAWLSNTLDLPLSLNSLTFMPTSQIFFVHVAGDGGSSLAFTGLGIQNLTAITGPIRQQLFADAGTTGGTIVFANSSGINLGTSEPLRPVDITALGGSVPGAIGGHIVFQDASSSGTQTFSSLRAEGASVLGASGGELIFRNNARTTRGSALTITVTVGTAFGAAGGQASFLDAAQVEGNVNVVAGTGGGQGGRAAFRSNAIAGLSIGLYINGATSSAVGAEAATSFYDDARLTGTVQTRAGGGSVVFHDDTFTRGARLIINSRAQSEGAVAGSAGGSTEFLDRSRAGQLTINNDGASSGAPGTLGGRTYLRNASSAESATIVSFGGLASGAPGGSLQFADDASAGAARLQNLGGAVALANGGVTQFFTARRRRTR